MFMYTVTSFEKKKTLMFHDSSANVKITNIYAFYYFESQRECFQL